VGDATERTKDTTAVSSVSLPKLAGLEEVLTLPKDS